MTCQDCKFFWVQHDYEGCPLFRCTANPPPVFDDKNGWMRPVVYPEDKACRFFQYEQEEIEVEPNIPQGMLKKETPTNDQF